MLPLANQTLINAVLAFFSWSNIAITWPQSKEEQRRQQVEIDGGFAVPRNKSTLWLIFADEFLGWTLVASFFPIAYAAILLLLLANALHSMRRVKLSSAFPQAVKPKDRTGLRTIHPELLDENGNVTEEELFIIRFPDKV